MMVILMLGLTVIPVSLTKAPVILMAVSPILIGLRTTLMLVASAADNASWNSSRPTRGSRR